MKIFSQYVLLPIGNCPSTKYACRDLLTVKYTECGLTLLKMKHILSESESAVQYKEKDRHDHAHPNFFWYVKDLSL